jgi:DeoR/GlpR family transcriptional regulator of sugar metabolism
MEKHRRNATDRHTQLAALLKAQGYCSVSEMSRILNVSPMTIRRDLHTLAEKQIVQVTHGGARFSASRQTEPDFDMRTHEHLSEKQAIGRRAAECFIEEGDVVGIDSGSTALEVARHLPDIPLTVVTQSLAAANIVAQNKQHQLIMPGGMLQHESSCLYGPQAITTLHNLHINKLFLAASGVLIPDGLSSSNLPDAEIKQALIKSARRIILCIDSSKIGQAFLAHFAPLDVVHVLVTDDEITTEDREALEHHGIQVITVSAHTTQDSSYLSLVNELN